MPDELSIARVHKVLKGLLAQAAHNVSVLGDDFPDYFDPRRGKWATNGGWTEGFWTGILWWLYVYSKDERFQQWAQKYTRLLAERKSGVADHDLGFLFYHSCVLEYLITGNQEVIKPALAAARRLADRFNPRGRFIRAHGALSDPERAGYAIIDTLMNLRLLFWAHSRVRESNLFEVALRTAWTISQEYVRDDGSSYQVVWFDPDTGEVERKDTLQGYSPTSCWSRGQAWGIYGFAQVYKFTGEPHFKDRAVSMARYFVGHLPPDGVAPYDFGDPGALHGPKDTSAQAITAAGLLALSELTAGAERQFCFAQAQRLLGALCADYVVEQETGAISSRGFLKAGCYFLAQGRGVDSELIFGDYYLVEAFMRYLSATLWQ
jgi:unsaturated chondroitin disaccharide hydrolase